MVSCKRCSIFVLREPRFAHVLGSKWTSRGAHDMDQGERERALILVVCIPDSPKPEPKILSFSPPHTAYLHAAGGLGAPELLCQRRWPHSNRGTRCVPRRIISGLSGARFIVHVDARHRAGLVDRNRHRPSLALDASMRGATW